MSRLQDSIRRVRRLTGLEQRAGGPSAPPPAATQRSVPAGPAVPASPVGPSEAPSPPAVVAPSAPQRDPRAIEVDSSLTGRLAAHDHASSNFLVLGDAGRSQEMPTIRRLSNELQDRFTAAEPAALSRLASERHSSLEFTESLGSLMSVTNPFGVQSGEEESGPAEQGTRINPANFEPFPPRSFRDRRRPGRVE